MEAADRIMMKVSHHIEVALILSLLHIEVLHMVNPILIVTVHLMEVRTHSSSSYSNPSSYGKSDSYSHGSSYGGDSYSK
jgi:hypothetical protein